MSKPDTATADETQSGSPRLQVLLGSAIVLVILGWIFRGFLWMAVQAFMLNVLPILFTPIILELMVAFVGLFIVLLFCHLRRKDQEDEWVYISQVEPESEMEQIPEPLKKRVGEMVLSSKPPEVETSELPFEAVEGFIELGLYHEAREQLRKASAADRQRRSFVRLWLLVCLRSEDWQGAREYAAGHPASPEDLARDCVEAASFFVRQKPPQKDAARQCLDLGKSLSVNAVVNAIESDGRLQKLA